MLQPKLAAAILAADLSNLAKSVQEASDAGVDLIHIDVADGVFSPNITLGAEIVAAIRRNTILDLDVHLMVANPEKHLEAFIKAGSNILTVHAEVCNQNSLERMLNIIGKAGTKIGLAIKPSTSLPEWTTSFLDSLYLINVMTIDPNFAGQSFNEQVISKLQVYSKRFLSVNPRIELEVDGGISPENARAFVDGGASILVAGAAIFRRGKVQEAVQKLRENTLHK